MYTFRNTYRQDEHTYIEDRGFLYIIHNTDEEFNILDEKFSNMLNVGESAIKSNDNEWEVVTGFYAKEQLAESLAINLRVKRDKLLADTDYLMISDYPISEDNKQKVQIYRQLLRDIPQQENWPFIVEWPVLSFNS